MAVDTLTMGPGTLVLGEVGSVKALSSQVTNARVVPSVDNGDAINVLSGESVPGDRTETWTLEGTLVQDFGTLDGVVEWLFTNRGTAVPFTFVPNTAAGREVTGTVTVEAVQIGGDAKTKPTSDFSFLLSGDPVIADVP